jgi:hypothetical protein
VNRSEAAKILTKASAFDNRDPNSEAAATAWAEALTDIPADPDAYAAVSRFYSDSTGIEAGGRRWMEPHHLRTIRRKIRAERLGSSGAVVYDGNPDESPTEYLASRRQQIDETASGRIQVPSVLAAIGPTPANGPRPLGEEDIRALRQQKDLARFMRDGKANATATCEQRKRLVLQYDDLAQQLTKAPMELARPDCWNGFLPPEHTEAGARNRSPVRDQLAALIAEAERRASRRPGQHAA